MRLPRDCIDAIAAHLGLKDRMALYKAMCDSEALREEHSAILGAIRRAAHAAAEIHGSRYDTPVSRRARAEASVFMQGWPRREWNYFDLRAEVEATYRFATICEDHDSFYMHRTALPSDPPRSAPRLICYEGGVTLHQWGDEYLRHAWPVVAEMWDSDALMHSYP